MYALEQTTTNFVKFNSLLADVEKPLALAKVPKSMAESPNAAKLGQSNVLLLLVERFSPAVSPPKNVCQHPMCLKI